MKRGEIWLVRLDPTLGAEIRKVRPAVIVSADGMGALPLRVMVPVTTWKDRYSRAPWLVRLDPTAENGLRQVSAADAFQIRSVSTTRFVERLGTLDVDAMQRIADALLLVLTD